MYIDLDETVCIYLGAGRISVGYSAQWGHQAIYRPAVLTVQFAVPNGVSNASAGLLNREVGLGEFLEGLCPTWRLRERLAFVADGGEDRIKHLIYS